MQTDKQPSSTGWTWMLAIVLGIVVAGLQDGFGGFVVGALLGVSLAQVLHLRTQLKRQSERIEELQFLQETRSEPPAEQPAASPPPRPAPAPAPRPAQPRQAPIFDKTTDIPAPVAATPAPPIAATAATPVAQPAPSPLPRRPAPPPVDTWTDKFIRWFKGGNPLARIGIVILFFGAAFLAKYAAENSLFPIELRFIALAIGAFALLIVGWRLRDRQRRLRATAAGRRYRRPVSRRCSPRRACISCCRSGWRFALLVVIALAAAILAVAQNALSLAVIGTPGGFLAPILVSTRQRQSRRAVHVLRDPESRRVRGRVVQDLARAQRARLRVHVHDHGTVARQRLSSRTTCTAPTSS